MAHLTFDDYLAIANTKARYCRCLDEKDWAGYGDTFTEDVILDTTPSGGKMIQGRQQLVTFVKGSVGAAKTAHQVHSPEITLVDGDTAEVIWAMQDRVVWDDDKARAIGMGGLTGYGHYREKYVRCDDGRWRIAASKLTRLHMDFDASGEQS